jgi:hypothetical protein
MRVSMKPDTRAVPAPRSRATNITMAESLVRPGGSGSMGREGGSMMRMRSPPEVSVRRSSACFSSLRRNISV